MAGRKRSQDGDVPCDPTDFIRDVRLNPEQIALDQESPSKREKEDEEDLRAETLRRAMLPFPYVWAEAERHLANPKHRHNAAFVRVTKYMDGLWERWELSGLEEQDKKWVVHSKDGTSQEIPKSTRKGRELTSWQNKYEKAIRNSIYQNIGKRSNSRSDRQRILQTRLGDEVRMVVRFLKKTAEDMLRKEQDQNEALNLLLFTKLADNYDSSKQTRARVKWLDRGKRD